ncbi:MAG: hypothetical protein MJB57_15800 [Gemmatimonadetes bacterium]|nr:hypothetical protein [Gemmatimonadota bacterium]
MTQQHEPQRSASRSGGLRSLLAVAALLGATACASSRTATIVSDPMPSGPSAAELAASRAAPSPDPRVGLAPGLFDAGEAIWNLRMVSTTPPSTDFVGSTNSDLAFSGNHVFQGNYDGVQVWDISNPAAPELVVGHVCPASQSDVSVYENLLFISGEGLSGRLDCGTQGVEETVSHHRLRGIRIFDISDVENPVNVGNVQTCRGSHTHTVLKHPDDDENVYIYVSGSAPVRPAEELAGCSALSPDEDPNSSLFRIEVIQVPLDDPGAAEIVSSPRIFQDLVAPPTHGMAPADLAAVEEARDAGKFIAEFGGQFQVLPDGFANQQIAQMMQAQGKSGPPTAADSAAFREYLPELVARMVGASEDEGDGPAPGPTQCHDITVYPEVGLAGGACEGYGLLLDISDPVNPVRIDAVADSNFSYWHSATLNNDGTAILFTDEWGGGGAPKCRESDPYEWGANAIFTIENRKMEFQSYFKLPAAQTPEENCVAHNGSLIPVPGRDIMIQGWYQGGISLIDWTDPRTPVEIAYFDRGPVTAERMQMGGSWSVYWYNGVIVNSEIARGLDIFELVPSGWLSQNEIDAANSVQLSYLNSQGQPVFEWPTTFALARAYVDQLERSGGLSTDRIQRTRSVLDDAERRSGPARRDALDELAGDLADQIEASPDGTKVRKLSEAVRALADA